MPARKDPVRILSPVAAFAAFYLTPLVLGFEFPMQSPIAHAARDVDIGHEVWPVPAK